MKFFKEICWVIDCALLFAIPTLFGLYVYEITKLVISK